MLHGEYKMPGGKLIIVDLEVHEQRLRNVEVSGDFFLEPDTALDMINAALEGQPFDSDEGALAAAVQAKLGQEVSMYGISPEAIAVAVRRALQAGEAR